MERGGPRPGSGRPKLPPGEKRKMRSMKATDEEWEKIKDFEKKLKGANKMTLEYKEATYDVYKTEDGKLIAVCTDPDCNCHGSWTLQEAD